MGMNGTCRVKNGERDLSPERARALGNGICEWE